MKACTARLAARGKAVLLSLLRSTHGGGMLVGGGLTIGLLAGVGSLMSDYAWREAQWEEIRSAVRAAVSASGALLAGAGGAMDAAIEERVGAFVEGLLPRLDLDRVTVAHDSGTNVTTVTVHGDYTFARLWRTGPESAEEITEAVNVSLDTTRYEVAVALDVSPSMDGRIPGREPGTEVTKLNALQGAMEDLTATMAAATATAPGSMMVSVVPFASAVNVADTATAGPRAERGHTPARERFVRMLAGADGTLPQALAAARSAGAQWVDTFHHYGVGTGAGPLRRQSLPEDLLLGRDWNLRRTDVAIDVSDAVPALGSWVVDDEDFWNGCVMARWGAYWHPDARPTGWSARDMRQWPATMAVPAWTPGGAALDASTPLHMGDAPPDSSDPNTLFTAYSWPDSRIGGGADHRLQTVMARLLEVGAPELPIDRRDGSLADFALQGDNDWSVPASRGGATLCPSASITPLTADLPTIRRDVRRLATVEPFVPCSGCTGVAGTLPHLGIAWGLRTLSPLWRNVWGVDDVQGRTRPGTPCVPGAAAEECTEGLHKAILLISDGVSQPGLPKASTLGHASGDNPPWGDSRLCDYRVRGPRYLRRYFAAAVEDDAAGFNAHFAAYMDGSRFGGAGLDGVLDAFHWVGDRWSSDTPGRRALRAAALGSVSPWQLFRGHDAGVVDTLMDEDNAFGFDRRPTQIGHVCRPSSPFGPYGRANDHVYVGDAEGSTGGPLGPVADVAPYNFRGLAGSRALLGAEPGSGDPWNLRTELARRLNRWFIEACRTAGDRGVRVHAIYIGDPRWATTPLNIMEDCVNLAGGSRTEREVFVTQDATALREAFAEIFTVRRNLRFLD